jgi:hypothetical protein
VFLIVKSLPLSCTSCEQFYELERPLVSAVSEWELWSCSTAFHTLLLSNQRPLFACCLPLRGPYFGYAAAPFHNQTFKSCSQYRFHCSMGHLTFQSCALISFFLQRGTACLQAAPARQLWGATMVWTIQCKVKFILRTRAHRLIKVPSYIQLSYSCLWTCVTSILSK